MARYEGMEDLLQRVRARLEVEDGDAPDAAWSLNDQREQYYTVILQALLVLLKDSHQVGKRMQSAKLKDFSAEQQNALRSTMGKVLRELLACRSKLEGAGEPE